MALDPQMLQGLMNALGQGGGRVLPSVPSTGGPFDNLSGVSLDIAGRQYADDAEAQQRAQEDAMPVGGAFGMENARNVVTSRLGPGIGPGWRGYFGAIRAKEDANAAQGKSTKFQYGE